MTGYNIFRLAAYRYIDTRRKKKQIINNNNNIRVTPAEFSLCHIGYITRCKKKKTFPINKIIYP